MELEKHRRVWLLFGISAVLLLVYVSSSSYNNDRSYSIWQRHAIDRDLVVADYASKWTARFGEKLKKWDTQRKRKLLAMNAFASIKHPDDPAKLIWKEPSDGQKLAIAIVEPRNHSCLPAVLYNFAHVYGGRDVSLYIFHGGEIESYLKEQVLKDWVNVQFINLKVDSMTRKSYSLLLTDVKFYEHFKSQFVLIFQTDSLIRRVVDEEFFQYDWVGAPWTSTRSKAGNGGFSLRRVQTMKDISQKYGPSEVYEDYFFKDYLDADKLPEKSVSSKFSVEIIWHPDPVGFHKFWRYGHNIYQVLEMFSEVPGLNLSHVVNQLL